MRILITNDDGINAPGLTVMEEIAADLAGPDGEVWVVAPAFEQSGVGHCISYTHPTMISQFGERRFAAEGSPADCVLAGLHYVLKDAAPDLILSGVNRGNNSAENTVYSGTIGGAMEGALQGVPSMALSQYLGPRNMNEPDPFESSRVHGAETVRRILAATPEREGAYRVFHNVNFPPVPAAQVEGAKAVAQGFRGEGRFGVEAFEAPNGRDFLWIRGGGQQEHTGADTDAGANLDGWISVTPMTADLTAREALAAMRDAL